MSVRRWPSCSLEGARNDMILGDHCMRLWAIVLVGLLSVLPVFAADTYVRVTVGKDGQLRILTAGGQTIAPKKDVEQVGFGKPQMSRWDGLPSIASAARRIRFR